MINLIYQAYGRADIIRQGLFSAASFLRAKPDFDGRIVFYTDQADQLSAFWDKESRVHIVPISRGELEAWGGRHKFVHRVKLEILLNASRRFDGHILYLDGDTIFTGDPSELLERLENNFTLMHIREYSFRSAKGILPKKIARFALKNKFELPGDQVVRFSEDTAMWNAGVIGVPRDQMQVLEKALLLTDALYENYQKHVMEQLAVSFCLAEASEILATDDVILHYWQNKDFYQAKIDGSLKGAAQCKDLLENFPNVNSWEPPPPPPPKKAFWRRWKEKLLSLTR